MEIDVSRWVCVYPPYINAKCTVAQGRRVSQQLAVCNPQVQEIIEVLNFLKLHHIVENKAYPRDILSRGRVRVRVKDEHGELLNTQVAGKNDLLKRLCEYIPRLKSRVNTEELRPTTDKKRRKRKNK